MNLLYSLTALLLSAASHTGGYTAFELDVTEALADGPAEIVVKVWDPTDKQTSKKQ